MEHGDGLALAHWSPDDVSRFASLRPVSSPSSRPSNSGEYGDQWPLLDRQVSPGPATRDKGPSAGIHEHVFSEHPYRRRKISQPGEYSDRWPLLVGKAASRPAAVAEDSSTSAHKYLFSEHPHRKGEHLRQSVFRWLPEILSSILSLGCVVAIVVVLAIHDNRELPSWPLGITLNTFLAFFTSVAKFGLVMPIMEGLGQLRWNWFSHIPRRLTDFELFDCASRGAWGSFRLVAAFKGGVLVFLGALVIVASLFTSPITQQVIQYPTRITAINGTATTPYATELGQIIEIMTKDKNAISNAMFNFKHHLLPGAYTPPEEVLADLSPLCSSGDCEFPDLVSLGVCTQVNNLTEQLTVSRLPDRDWQLVGLADNTTWSANLPGFPPLVVPNLKSFDIFTPHPGMPPLRLPTPSAERNLSIADIVLVYHNPPGPQPSSYKTGFFAVEVLFHWCTKAYSVRVSAGTPHWTELGRAARVIGAAPGSFNLATTKRYACATSWMHAECLLQRWDTAQLAAPPGFDHAVPAGAKIMVQELTALAVSGLLHISFWRGYKTPFWATTAPQADTDGGMFMLGETIYRLGSDISMAFGGALWRDFTGVADPGQQFEAVRNITGNMGKAMENYIRAYLNPFSSSTGLQGTVRGPTPYVQIRWAWLLFLSVELLLSTLFLVGTIVVTKRSRMQVIKTSSLATMCALDEPTRRRLGEMHDMAAVEDAARRTDVRLEKAVSGVAVYLSGSR